MQIKIGDKIRFTPTVYAEETWAGGEKTKASRTDTLPTVLGTVVHIHPTHRHYTLEFQAGSVPLRETFKF